MNFGFVAAKAQKSFEVLAERAKQRGHTVSHIPLRDMPLSATGLTDFVKECAAKYDALHYYAGLADPVGIFFGQICDDLGIPLLNNRAHIPHLTHDKMYQTLAFSRAGLPTPKTEFSRSPNLAVLQAKLGSPIIAKRNRGTHGAHVSKITAQAELDALESPSSYLYQEYLPHRNDVRVLVLNGKAICGYCRVPSSGDFRANLARGGRAEALVDQADKDITFSLAEAAIKAIPHDLAGVDLIKSEIDGAYRLIEINVNPSWYGLTELTESRFEDALLNVYESMAHERSST